MLEELLAEIPSGVLDLLKSLVWDRKKAATLFRELKVTSLAELRTACEQQPSPQAQGFGAKTETTISVDWILLRTLAINACIGPKRISTCNVCDNTLPIVLRFSNLSSLAVIDEVKETIGDLDILIDATDVTTVMDRFAEFPESKRSSLAVIRRCRSACAPGYK